MTSLFSRVLEAPFPTKRMIFPFAAPVHWRNYGRMFNCPVDFSADSMEWHFDAGVLELPCPNANPITAQVCQQFCDVVMAERPGEADLVRKIRTAKGPYPYIQPSIICRLLPGLAGILPRLCANLLI